jgi:hypothetical protein
MQPLTKDEKYNIIKEICPNTTECISFGTQSDEIRELFDEFKIPSDLINKNEIKQIGEKSANGIIYRLKYEIKKYNAYTILKNAISEDADNLYYEAVVGWYINSKMRYYPCFVETYDLYKNTNPRDPNTNMMTDFKLDNLNPLFPEDTTTPQQTKSLEEVETDFYNKITEGEKLIETCKESDTISLHIQYLENVSSLFETLIKNKKQNVFSDICTYLYQVYAPLSMLSDEFTHYDLHTGNVLIYKVDPNKYTRMIYHYPDNTTVEFNTDGIAKIIDYGRCYFKYNDTINSKNFIDKLDEKLNLYMRKNPTKDKIYSYDCGYTSFYKGFKDNYYIDSRTHNKSHDLRLVKNVNDIYQHYIKQNMFNIEYKKEYGTPEVSQKTYTNIGDRIYNVNDMHAELREMLMADDFKKVNDALEKKRTLYGTIKCWLDGSTPMIFTPSIPDESKKPGIFSRMFRNPTKSTVTHMPSIPIPKSLQHLIQTPYLEKPQLQNLTKSVGGKTKRNRKTKNQTQKKNNKNTKK